MDTCDLQQYTFLYLCSAQDRRVLLGKRNMKFSEFRRFLFLVEQMGFKDYWTLLWNQFSDQFIETIDILEKICRESYETKPLYIDLDYETLEEESWVDEFISHMPMYLRGKMRAHMLRQKPDWEDAVATAHAEMEDH
jgi:hypothetical protein